MQFGVMNNGDGPPTNPDDSKDLDLKNPEHIVAVFQAVGDAMQRLNAMELADTRPSPSEPAPHPLDEREVGE